MTEQTKYIIDMDKQTGNHKLVKKNHTTINHNNIEVGIKLKTCHCYDNELKLDMIRLEKNRKDKVEKSKRKESFAEINKDEFYNSKCIHHNCVIS